MNDIFERKKELEKFLSELDEARKHSKECNTLKISPLAGILEKQELENINRILKVLGYII